MNNSARHRLYTHSSSNTRRTQRGRDMYETDDATLQMLPCCITERVTIIHDLSLPQARSERNRDSTQAPRVAAAAATARRSTRAVERAYIARPTVGGSMRVFRHSVYCTAENSRVRAAVAVLAARRVHAKPDESE